MARTGLTKQQVRIVRERLQADGIYPSVDAVRRALGDTGSKSTIHRYLKELEGGDAGRADTARTLQVLVEQLADRLHDDAERRLRARYEEALRRKDEELAALRETVAALEARINQPEAAHQPKPPRRQALPAQPIGGFGSFGLPLSVSRGGHHDISPFSIMRAGGRTEVFDPDSVLPGAMKLA